ncbi:MAG TPA: hypothetical protein DCL74_07155 [Succinivibrionaceae bacterium]|nr:hypothetical protein [Succinivibrionaceae bacterium]
MNIDLLKAEIVRQGLTISKVAAAIGVSDATLYSRFSKASGKPFSLELASKLSQYLGLSPDTAFNIFLKNN